MYVYSDESSNGKLSKWYTVLIQGLSVIIEPLKFIMEEQAERLS